jgi:hypothetical protein
MRIRGVEFPRALIEAHERGELVIFVGAGASMPSPSDLPSFAVLVETIRDQSCLADVIGAVNGEVNFRPLDELLDQMATDHGVDVHARIASLIDAPNSKPNPVHEAIARLAASSPHMRIVTTNYDHHLQRSSDRVMPEYLAPALPVGNDFEGIVYLHGRLGQDPSKLISTATDFGKAYLTDAWAAQFLDRMFASHPVLFIGYSHNDTIMKYLARGLGGRAKPRYILTNEPDSPLWKQLGVEPVHCSHEGLSIALDEWASQASMGLLAHREHVRALVAEQEPSQIPDDIAYLESIIANETTVKFFTEYARGELWLRWLANNDKFRALFNQGAPSDSSSWVLPTWFAESYVTEELSDVALTVVTQMGGRLGPELAFAIGRHLARDTVSMPPQLRPWLLLVASDLRYRHPNFLDFILPKLVLPTDRHTALFLIDHLTEPALRLAPQLYGDSFEIDVRGDDYWLRRAWKDVFLPNITEVADELILIVDRQLRRADRELSLADTTGIARSRPSDFREAIEPHPQDQYPGPLAFLVDVARDCLEALIEADDARVQLHIESWADSNVTLLRRLAVHGWGKRLVGDATEKLRWIGGRGWIADRDLRHEVERIIVENVGQADAETTDALVTDIAAIAGEDDFGRWRAFRLLKLVIETAPTLVSAQEALAVLQRDYPVLEEQVPRIIEQDKTPAVPLPTSAAELHTTIGEDMSGLRGRVVDLEAKAEQFDAYQWERFGRLLSEVVQQWPEDGFIILDSVGQDHTETTKVVVRGWASAELDSGQDERVIARVASLELAPIVDYVAYMLDALVSVRAQTTNWRVLPAAIELAKKCWDAIDPRFGEGATGDDLVLFAFNHPSGRVASFWISVLSDDWTVREDTWDGLNPDVAAYLQSMLDGNDTRAEVVETVFGAYLRFFHGADATWCQSHLLPRFDWKDPARARRVWDGYLSTGTWTNGLLSAGFLSLLIETVGHREVFRSDRGRRLLSQLAAVAMFADFDPQPWITQLLTGATASDRVEWAEQVTFHLRSLEPEAAEQQWHRWIHAYWQDRVDSIPMILDAAEAAAMANWAIFFKESMSEAIELALRTPAGLGDHALFFYDLTPPSGSSRIEHAPEHLAALVSHLLTSTNKPFHGGYELPDVLSSLESHGVSVEAIQRIRGEAVRLDIPLGQA